jgi:hypothetical protein
MAGISRWTIDIQDGQLMYAVAESDAEFRLRLRQHEPVWDMTRHPDGRIRDRPQWSGIVYDATLALRIRADDPRVLAPYVPSVACRGRWSRV